MTLRYALIGAGMMGQEHLRNIALLPDTLVCDIAEPDAGMRAASAALAGPQAALHDDWRALLAASRADAFVVAAPNHLHAEMLEALIDDGRPVLCEKPAVTGIDQGRRLARLAEGRDLPVWVAMEYRYMPAVSDLVAAVHAGEAGALKLLSVVERRFPFLPKVGDWNRFNRLSGGTLVEKCCHFFDLMRLIVRAEPLWLQAIGGQAVNHLDETYGGQVPDILDHAFVTLEFDGGVRGLLELCMFAEGAHFQERVSAIGTQALLEARVPGPGRFEPDGRHKNAEFVCARRADRREEVQVCTVDPALLAAGDHHGSTFFQHLGFHRMVLQGGRPEVTLHDGLRAVAIGLAAQTAIAERRPVEMTEFALT